MPIPIGTDAPVYHRPWGTIGLIVTNIVCFALTGGGTGTLADTFTLEFSNGLHPTQWLLSNFLHFGVAHLIGNMVFLWIFGLVVEGKIGLLRFLSVYLAIGVAGGMIEQIVMLGYDGYSIGSGGASLAIYGLIAISLIWAPRNEVSFIGFIFYRPFFFELTIMTTACWYLGIELLFAWFGDFSVSSSMLHLLGAAIGGAIGWRMLQKNQVDCEGWDIVSVWQGRPESSGYFEKYRAPLLTSASRIGYDEPEPSALIESDEIRKKKRRMVKRFRKALEEGDLAEAMESRRKLSLLHSDDLLNFEDLHELIKRLLADDQWKAALPVLEGFVIRFPDQTIRHRLKLVELYLKKSRRPREAFRMLTGLEHKPLTDEEQQYHQKLLAQAQQMIDDGVYEIA